MTYDQYIHLLETEYDINSLSFVEEHIIYTNFLAKIIEEDEALSEDDKAALEDIVLLAFHRLKDKYNNIETYRTHCLEQYEKLKDTNSRVARYYLILSTLFTESSVSSDPTTPYTSIQLFMRLLNDIDERYTLELHDHITKALDELY